jgi:precorrin-6B methylase 2
MDELYIIKKDIVSIYEIIRLTYKINEFKVNNLTIRRSDANEYFINLKIKMNKLNIKKDEEMDELYNYIIRNPKNEEEIILKVNSFINSF